MNKYEKLRHFLQSKGFTLNYAWKHNESHRFAWEFEEENIIGVVVNLNDDFEEGALYIEHKSLSNNSINIFDKWLPASIRLKVVDSEEFCDNVILEINNLSCEDIDIISKDYILKYTQSYSW